MADKKITALTELNSTGKVSSTDLLHIIDYSASPVNKKITVSNLLKDANTAITSFGAFTHDLGPTNAISGLSVVVPNTTPAASAETEVVVNDDGNAFVDFRVESSLSASAIHVDASVDATAGSVNTVTINGDSAKVDFKVNSDSGILVHCDSNDHVVGIGLATPDTAYLLDVAAVGGKSIKAAGGIDVTGVSSITGATTITGDATVTGTSTLGGLVKFSQSAGATVVGTADGTVGGVIPLTTVVSHLSAGVGGVNNDEFDLADGVQGQIKICVYTTQANSAVAKVTPASFDGTSIDMNTPGESVTLLFTNSKWYPIGTTYDVVIT
jgi:hypothetical protein